MSDATGTQTDLLLQRAVQAVQDVLGCGRVVLVPPGERREQAVICTTRAWAADPHDDLPDSPLLSVPVVVSGEVVAVLEACGPASGDFEERDRRLAQTLVDLLATAIEREQQAACLQQELDHSMAQYRAVLDYQTDLICRFRPDGILTFVNLTYCRYFGQEREALIGHSFLPLVLDEDREMTRQHLASFGPRKPVATTERRVLAVGGKLRWQQWIDRPIFDAQGDIVEFQSVGRDITEQKQQELELRQYREHLEELVETRTAELHASREHLSRINEELTHAARLKDEFLANMSHELRTPLTSILGLSEILDEEVFGPLTERQARAVRTINTSGQHLLALINDILDVSKIEAGKLELNCGMVDVCAICESALLLVEPGAREKGLTVTHRQAEPGVQIMADSRRLKQILVNLLSNAVKFTPKGGHIGLEITVEHGKAVHFTVWDTGIGIAEEDISRLFQPFVQLDSNLSREYGGSGLGLSLVHRLTGLHGGSMRVESEVGRGSRFTVTLPHSSPSKLDDPGMTQPHH